MPQRRHSLGATALALVLGWADPAAADAVLDGTTGSTGTFSGDFEIPAGVGRREGANLFHSFERFSVLQGESATFTGPSGIDNVISRVTGGELSRINGILASEIPGADFFFLNPAGVIFGPQASLAIDGSFHVSTADELRFDDGSIFSATNPNASSFTVAAPEAFGFLGADAGPITLNGAGLFLDTPDVAPFNRTISLVGGDIIIDQSQIIFLNQDDFQGFERGNVNLVAMSNVGDVTLEGEPSSRAEGSIRLIGDNENIIGVDVSSSNGGGRIRVHAGRLILHEGAALTSDHQGGGTRSGGIEITANRVDLLNGSTIFSNAFGPGDAGDIRLNVNDLRVLNDSQIGSDTGGTGDAGRITIRGDGRIIVGDDRRPGNDFLTAITSEVGEEGEGDAGGVVIRTGELIVRNDGFVSSETLGGGDAGDVRIRADRVVLRSGGQIASGTTRETGATGAGGSLRVVANDEIIISGQSATVTSDRTGERLPSGIFSSSESRRGGPAGDVQVRAPVIRLADRGEISSETDNDNDGGDVTVRFVDLLEVDNAEITTQARFTLAGDAGDITVTGPGVINLIDSSADRGQISTSAPTAESSGNAGDITVRAGTLILNNGLIRATGVQGRGGNIDVSARDALIASADSRITALSERNVDGTVTINTASEDVLEGLEALPTAFVDVSGLLREGCAAQAAAGREEGSSLVVTDDGGGIAPGPEAPLTGRYAGRASALSSGWFTPTVACSGRR